MRSEMSNDKNTLEAATTVLGRRKLMKMGLGLGVAAAGQMLPGASGFGQQPGAKPQVAAPNAASQDSPEEAARLASVRDGASKPVPGGPPYLTPHEAQHRVAKYGEFMNTSGRLYGNGPMDETSRRVVSYVNSFKVNITP